MAISGQRERRTWCVQGAQYTNGNTASARFDLLGADSAEISVSVTFPSNTSTIASADGVKIEVLSGDSTNATTFTTVAANKTGIKVAQAHHYLINNQSGKRYVDVKVSPGTSGVSNELAVIAVHGVLSRVNDGPSSTSEMQTTNSTNDTVVIASV